MVYDSVSQMPLFQKPFSALKVMMDAYIKTENHKKWKVSEIENGSEFKVLTAVSMKVLFFWMWQGGVMFLWNVNELLQNRVF